MRSVHARHICAVLALAALAACSGNNLSSQKNPVIFPAGWPFPAGREATFAPNGIVASNSAPASEAGLEILRQGGNAVDAAVAVGFALAVSYPEAGNIGGGGYMVIRMADGRKAALDFREVAPLKATRDMYVGANGELTGKSLVGHLASGVPGAVAGLTEAHAKYGTLPLAKVMEPAIKLAEEGVVVDSALAASLTAAAPLINRFSGKEVWLAGGSAPAPGSVIKQPALAAALRAIATDGAKAFYDGPVGAALVAEMEKGGGLISAEDLRGYKPVWREALETTYRNHTIISMPPSSSGGTTIAETLNILETFGPLPQFGSASYTHLVASAYKLAFVDRNAKIADPEFVPVPVAQLTSKDYARTLAAQIDRARATPTPRDSAAREGSETTHYSVVDSAGNAVATTTTINELYGSGVFVPGAGFFLNNEMDDFTARPGKPNTYGLIQGEQNAIAPRKRMLSAMSPSIVLDPSGNLLMVLGSRGGPRIITSVSQVILNVIDHRMTLADALSAPRIHHQALPDTLRYERAFLAGPVADSLATMGHGLSTFGNVGLVIAIMRTPNGWHGMVDPRSAGGVSGH